MLNFEDVNKKSKEAVDTMVKNYSEVAKGMQSIAAEAQDYSKKSFQDLAGFMEQLTAARSIETVFELQTKYAKSSYETFVSEATKITEMYADLAKTAYKPYEAPIAKASKAASAATAA
ncbi:phasin family protein [Agrobacterium vitis]|uniref:Phasin family protein n=1 Tax=Agrobacterium vitis TaxID=373 RepID=A0AAE4WAY3_AGRVI|nr:phasin family protein [Agrobacterium vitis]MCF1496962.1 phasin family protein [Allorhizobium sp. Av2]MCM2440040.1 phasin family protein [Agrobacterium vitis]MUZ57063.1 phasin family protein [Agrobacterium vitis]MVA65372.1 phasin family protein [Agrobacterium vitis]MVA86397.1 phasin family protein [Agrobacterium vitis]